MFNLLNKDTTMRINFQSGLDFKVYDKETHWYDTPGLYAFAFYNAATKLWEYVYIGETGSFKSRIPCHECWEEAVRHGATHVLAAGYSGTPTARKDLETRLIAVFDPVVNKQKRVDYGAIADLLYGLGRK